MENLITSPLYCSAKPHCAGQGEIFKVWSPTSSISITGDLLEMHILRTPTSDLLSQMLLGWAQHPVLYQALQGMLTQARV